MKLASALKFEDTLRIREFELRGNKFSVRVPVTSEMEALIKRIDDISNEEYQKRFDKMRSNFNGAEMEGIEIKDDDVIVDGNSIKDTVKSVLKMEKRIVEYFKLLVPVEGNFDGVTYEDIENEFPLQVQFELIEKISDAIQPGYKDAKKN